MALHELVSAMAGQSSLPCADYVHLSALPAIHVPLFVRQQPASVLLAVRALARRRLAGRERIDRRGAALLEVLVGLRFLLFLVAAHLTLGHDVSPLAPG